MYGNEYRKDFLSKNPDKSLTIDDFLGQVWGTSKYRCTWKGDWTAEELVNYVDGQEGNYGGRIDNIRINEDGSKTGTICVYYD